MKRLFARAAVFVLSVAAFTAALLIDPSVAPFGPTPAHAQAQLQAKTQVTGCTVETFANLDGRKAASLSASERRQIESWCAKQRTNAQTAKPPGPGQLAANMSGAEPIWCPAFSKKCVCVNAGAWQGCSNFKAHCKSGLSCGKYGHVCSCDSN
jgi:hypothetical protein